MGTRKFDRIDAPTTTNLRLQTGLNTASQVHMEFSNLLQLKKSMTHLQRRRFNLIESNELVRLPSERAELVA